MKDTLYESDVVATPRNALPTVPKLSHLMVYLLKGVLYRNQEERLWSSLLRLQTQVREHTAVLWLDLVLDEAEGYAFLKSRPDPDAAEGSARPPRLIVRRALPYKVSLMLALLRKRMAESDARGGAPRLVLTREEIAELMRVFLPDATNEARLIDQLDTTIKRVVELGFLRPLPSPSSSTPNHNNYEVSRILKAFVDAQWLAEFDARLEAYHAVPSDDQDDQDEPDTTPEAQGESGDA
ncbi:DUF4194 domain-containing protein [Xylella fastidiosa subsp. fastidiosa]|jgi:hypothetical protein|uniref:DUF4194 domain-containing protein n=2 Tax=Xylella fastidiosa TaxID=2371 RepID=Q879W0_XYLFT|nr:DUF4194 domain-containing protein [Xylella fastidiosa]ADN62948.1 hypothetical protein XFLM_04950 [Xylella fastidiosa subsp. fastidiosa GB514]KAF0571526.1 hypothetical protein P305_03940 [Xylella fastidiosa subsp. fastidiosa Mus-1]AAO29903.1 conserved hypothetical protein [Xylella fastidiosa Temecula1]ACB93581.1 conserved hypothetical protein [Xylella fastidiosa M23]EGO82879.1 hypothetical protein XFEB_00211 [Xylella fastidiosa EB92.1]